MNQKKIRHTDNKQKVALDLSLGLSVRYLTAVQSTSKARYCFFGVAMFRTKTGGEGSVRSLTVE